MGITITALSFYILGLSPLYNKWMTINNALYKKHNFHAKIYMFTWQGICIQNDTASSKLLFLPVLDNASVCVCVCVRACVCACMRACVRACMHVHACTDIHNVFCMCVSSYACVYMCMHVCLPVCICVWESTGNAHAMPITVKHFKKVLKMFELH